MARIELGLGTSHSPQLNLGPGLWAQRGEEVPVGEMAIGRQAEIPELCKAVMHNKLMFHDGRWGEATLEVCLGILQSTAERREVQMFHQTPVPV